MLAADHQGRIDQGHQAGGPPAAVVLAADPQGRIDQGHQHMRVPDRVPDRMPEGQGMGTPPPPGHGLELS